MEVLELKESIFEPKDFTDIIGGHGPWQMGIFTFFFFAAAPHCMHNLIMAFFAPNVEHWCARSPEALAANVSIEQWKNECLPMENTYGGGMEYSKCTVYNITYANGSVNSPLLLQEDPIKCNYWEYDLSFYTSTVVDEWNLVCDREWLISIAKTVYMVGFLLSSTLSGQISDRIGRRPVVITCLCMFLTAAFLTLLSESFLMFLILRFIIALGLTSVFTISYVILPEIVSAEYRSFYCINFKCGWIFAYMLLPGIAYLIPSWFWLQITITVPWLTLLCVFWVVPETPCWLLAHGKFQEAQEILLRAAKKNKKDMKKTKAALAEFLSHQIKSEDKRKATFFDLMKTPGLRKSTLNIYFCWFIIAYIYYALSWNTNDLGGDPYITFFVCGAVELPAIILFLYISKAVGHRRALLISNVLAGVCLLLLIPVPAEMTWLSITFAMAGKFFNSASFDIVFILTAEVLPTVTRNVGVGSSSTCARIGALVAPFIRQLGDVTHPVVPLAVPGALSVISGFLLLLLPETKGVKLPDTLEEGERFSTKVKLKRMVFKDSNNEINFEEQQRMLYQKSNHAEDGTEILNLAG